MYIVQLYVGILATDDAKRKDKISIGNQKKAKKRVEEPKEKEVCANHQKSPATQVQTPLLL